MAAARRVRGRVWTLLLVGAAVLASLVGCQTCHGDVRLHEDAAGEAAAAPRELVVLLHGMKRTGRSMKPMAKALRAAGYDTLLCDYPSVWGVRDTSEKAFGAIRPRLEGRPKVHFVTHSLGGILLREAFRDGGAPPNLGRVVMLSPPNGGCEHIDHFSWIPFFGAIWGVPAKELGTGPDAFPRGLPPVDFPCGVIAGTKSGALGQLMPKPNDGKVTVRSAGDAPGIAEVLELPVNHTWMMRDPEVVAATLRFLRDGTFSAPSADSAADAASDP